MEMEAPPPVKEEEVTTMVEQPDWPMFTGEPRLRLRPWLEFNLDNNSIPGLEWLDNEKSYFKIPWKHRSKKDWEMEHIQVFLEWAKHTGKYQQGQDPDFVAMKTRLRCAFNKAPDIEEEKEMHRLKCPHPYKVYRFIQKPDVDGWREALAHLPKLSGNTVCAVNPMYRKSNQGDESCSESSEEEDDVPKPPTTPLSPAPNIHMRPSNRKKHKQKIRDILNNQKLDTPIPSTLAAAQGLLSLNSPTDTHVSETKLEHAEDSVVRSSNPPGLITSLLMAPPRLPLNAGLPNALAPNLIMQPSNAGPLNPAIIRQLAFNQQQLLLAQQKPRILPQAIIVSLPSSTGLSIPSAQIPIEALTPQLMPSIVTLTNQMPGLVPNQMVMLATTPSTSQNNTIGEGHEGKRAIPSLQKTRNLRSRPHSGVTYTNKGAIMTTGIVNTIKHALAQRGLKGAKLAEETLRMRQAYGTAEKIIQVDEISKKKKVPTATLR